MEHTIVLKEEGRYSAFPVLDVLPDGRLAIGCVSSPFGDHHGLAARAVLMSADGGRRWSRCDAPDLPPNWPGSQPRELCDRMCRILPDGSYRAVTSVGFEVWPLERRAEAEGRGLSVDDHEQLPGQLLVGGHRLVSIASHDAGNTWERHEWTVPGYAGLVAFPRGTVLEDGTWLLPGYAWRPHGGSDCLMLRSVDGEHWDLHTAVSRIGSEWAVAEVAPGRILGHIRSGHRWDGAKGERMFGLEVWSQDGGVSWTHPVETTVEGYPNHLLKLRDGRLLCTTGYRREPMGIRAVLSEDGGRTWDVDGVYVLRDDGGTKSTSWTVDHGSGAPDLGYPISTELADGMILTIYYITLDDGVTHVAATHWHPERDR